MTAVLPQAYGIWWHTWRRHRLGLATLAAYLGLLSLAAHVPKLVPDAVFALCVPLGFGLAYVIAIFSHPDADITGVGSGYPSHLFLLPVRTRLLVLVPMLGGALFLCVGWALTVALVLNPKGANLPFVLPMATLVAILASLQALFWAPIGVPYVRLGIVLMLVPGLLLLAFSEAVSWTSQTRSWILLSLAVASYGVAVWAVHRARHLGGRASTVPKRVSRAPSGRVQERAPFRSPQSAQRWFEWRRNGTAVPFAMAIFSLLVSWPVIRFRDLAYFGPAPEFADPKLLMINAYARTFFLVPPIAALFLAWLFGCAFRRADAKKKDQTLHLYYATRPATTWALLEAKLATNAMVGLLLAMIAIVTVGMWTLTAATDARGSELLLVKLERMATPDVWLEILACVLLTVMWSVRNAIVGTLATVSSSPVIHHGYKVASFCLPVVALAYSTMQRSLRGEEIVVLAAYAVLAVKTALTVWGLAELRRRRQIGWAGIAVAAMGWILLAAVAVWCALTAREAALRFLHAISGSNQISFPEAWTVAVVAVVFTPIARLVWALAELDSNRHGRPSRTLKREPT